MLTFPVIHAQNGFTVSHRPSGDSGSFSADPQDPSEQKEKVTVSELNLTVRGSSDRTVIVSADVTVEYPAEAPGNFSAVVKSYADPDFERKVEYKESDGEVKEELSEIEESSVPTKLYLEVKVDGVTEEHFFWDKSGLESIVSGLNGQYGLNLEVTGEGRAVAVRNSSFKKKIEERTLSRRLYASSDQINSSSYLDIFKFDPVELEKQLLSDRIMSENGKGNFSVVIDRSDMYVNGNKVPDKLLPKYRKLFGKFSVLFSDI